MQRMAVIGAGISGVTTARALMERGFDVTVYDKNRYAAMETSFANGGQLSASNAEVWNRWSTVLKGLKWMMKRDAPLSVNPTPCWHKISWMMEFLTHIPKYRENTIETVRLAIKARELLVQHSKTYNFDFNKEDRGIMHIYTDESEYKHAEMVTEMYREGGLKRYAVSPDEMRKIEPALTHNELIAGFWTPSDFTGDIHRYTVGLAKGIEAEGVHFELGNPVDELKPHEGGIDVFTGEGTERSQETFDGVVVCAGCRSRDFASQLGDRVNIYPVKGYSITVKLNDDESREAAPWASLLDDKAKIVTSRLGRDRFRVAGTAEFNGYNRDIRQDRIEPLVKWCETYFPGMSTEEYVPWAGLRPMMPTMMPRIGAGRRPGVLYNTGHGHLGWTLSAATAEMVGEIAAGQRAQGYAGPSFTFACNSDGSGTVAPA